MLINSDGGWELLEAISGRAFALALPSFRGSRPEGAPTQGLR